MSQLARPINEDLTIERRDARYANPPEPGDFAETAEPFALFGQWLADAERHETEDPTAMALATVDRSGQPNVRMVLLKALDPPGRADRGFVFYTNFESAKGAELLATPKAALLFHWKSAAPPGAGARAGRRR